MSKDCPITVVIVDYGMGNLYNVRRACECVDLNASITSRVEDILDADGVILPGVGAMPEAMKRLDETGLSDALRAVAARGTPLFGVCLGMQLLMKESDEFSLHQGLGIMPGLATRFQGISDDGGSLRVPHIGWNAVRRVGDRGADAWKDSPLQRVRDGEYMYFVHSYHVVPGDPSACVARTRYGSVGFCSALAVGNVFGCQFHPERSGPAGLEMYRQFAIQVEGFRRQSWSTNGKGS